MGTAITHDPMDASSDHLFRASYRSGAAHLRISDLQRTNRVLDEIRLVIAGILFLVGGLITLTNWYYLFLGIRHPGERVPSYIPFIGGIAGAAGLSLVPLASISDRLIFLWVLAKAPPVQYVVFLVSGVMDEPST